MKIDVNILKENVADLEVFNKIMLEDEIAGRFDHDQDSVDPNSYDPIDENFPYIRKGFKWWIKQAVFNHILNGYTKKINKQLTNLKIEGRQNLKGVKGAIITCNHISKVDSFAVRAAAKSNIMYVAAEHNNWKGIMGEIARNTGFIALPPKLKLSLMRKFNDAIKFYLKKGKKVLIYPEQAMWREYPKPRPLQIGAYHYAATNNVPVLPMFITLKDKAEKVDELGRANFSDYTIHILPAIYPDKTKPVKENEEAMRKENFRVWQELYEATYGKKLEYAKAGNKQTKTATTNKSVKQTNMNEAVKSAKTSKKKK